MMMLFANQRKSLLLNRNDSEEDPAQKKIKERN